MRPNLTKSLCNLKSAAYIAMAVFVFCFVTACAGDPSESMFEDYRERLGRSIQQPAVEPIPIQPAVRPNRRALRVESTDQRIGLIEFLSLYDCALWQVIGERNSALGRVAPASQRLFMELDFLRLAPTCADTLEAGGREALAQTLRDAHSTKQRELPILLWQATLGSQEFEQLWHVPSTLGDYNARADLSLIEALTIVEQSISRWIGGDYRYDDTAFERSLGSLSHGNAGFWTRAAVLMTSELEAASQMARNRLNRRPLCFQGKANPQARIFLNVVQGYFVGNIQLWAADINRALYQVGAIHRRIEKALNGVQPANYKDWVTLRELQLNQIKAASRQHVEALQPLLRSCGLLPK